VKQLVLEKSMEPADSCGNPR